MQTSLYSVTVPVFIKMLENLRTILEKAEIHNEGDALLEKRLAPDQFPLVKQVQIACDNAKAYTFRLNGEQPPSFEDNETTIGQLKDRISATLAILADIKPEQVDGHEDAQVRMKYFEGQHFTGFAYTTDYILPNFFFHIVTAYSILRNAGLVLGKMDYLGALSLRDDA